MKRRVRRFADEGWAFWVEGEDTSAFYVNQFGAESAERASLRVARLFISFALAFAMGACLTACSTEQDDASGQSQMESAENGTEQESPIDYGSAVVSYLGPEGTYTQEACQVFFQEQGSYLPMETVGDAVQALIAGESGYAVIPQENTIGGPVIDYLDQVLLNEGLSIVGEVELPINQNLLVKPGTQLDQVEVVYSHAQGLIQGKAWLEENAPQALVIEVASTAEGARMVSQSDAANCAAIGSKGAADVYGLEVLAEGIQMSDSNKTRFYVLSCEEPSVGVSDRMAFVAAGWAADLPQLLSSVAEQGMRVVALHDRPEKTELGRYLYLVECENASYEGYSAVSENDAFEFRFLGCFPVE